MQFNRSYVREWNNPVASIGFTSVQDEYQEIPVNVESYFINSLRATLAQRMGNREWELIFLGEAQNAYHRCNRSELTMIEGLRAAHP